jgi:hypothetical protein
VSELGRLGKEDRMSLTPDQKHCFAATRHWRDFRAMFPSVESALQAYAAASQETEASQAFTHEVEWRFIFHNRESKKKQLLALLLLPLGHIGTSHAEFRFKTRHSLSAREVARLTVGRSFGAIAYYLCFIAIIATGAGVVIAIVDQVFSGASFKMGLLIFGLLMLAALLLGAAARTRSLGLFGTVRLIAQRCVRPALDPENRETDKSAR